MLIFLKVAKKSCIKLLGTQPRLQVYFEPCALRIVGKIARSTEHQRAAHAEMGKEHFAELLIYGSLLFPVGFGFLISSESNVLQRKAHKLAHPAFLRFKRYQRGLSLKHGMPQGLCKAIAVTRRTR